MIDIHAHILPALDDGARSLEEALKMGRLAQSDGIREMIVTPHATELGQFANPRSADYDVDDGPWGIGIAPNGNI